MPVFRGIPDIQIDGFFYKSRYSKDHGNQVPDIEGPAVHSSQYRNFLIILSIVYYNLTLKWTFFNKKSANF